MKKWILEGHKEWRTNVYGHKNSILSPIAQVFYDYARKYYEKHPEKAPE